MIKIVYCVPTTSTMGGLERILSIKTRWLCDNGYDVSIVTTDQGHEMPFFSFDERIHFFDLGIFYRNNANRLLPLKAIMFVVNHVRHRYLLKRALNQIHPDITVSMFFQEMSFLPKLNDGSKKVLEFHFCKLNQDFATTKVYPLQIKAFDKFVVLTEQDLLAWGGLCEYPNVCSIPNFSAIDSSSQAVLNNHIVVAVGRLVPIKAYDRLIDIWAGIKDCAGDWQLQIWGDGPLRDELQKQIEVSGVADSVKLMGVTKNVRETLLSSSLFVMTSINEGFPMSMTEAQGLGLPIVSFDFPCGPAEIVVDGKNGFLIKDGDMSAFRGKLLDLITDDEKRHRFGASAYKDAKRYDVDAIMLRWNNLFHSLLPN